jgi:diguanylate cyclase (GGDEF)-like protein
MVLDSDTFIVFLAVLSFATGVTLFVVGRQSNATAPGLLWGLSNLLIALGVILLAERIAEAAAFLFLASATALMWCSIVVFNRRSPPFAWFIAGGLVWAFAAVGPPASWSFGPRAAIYLAVCAFFLFQCAWELWRGREERLPARWPLMGLVALDAVSVVFGIIQIIPLETLGQTPDRGTLWPVYMVTTLFIVGTAVFLMSMIKERAVAEQRSLAQTDNLTGLANRGALMASGAAIVRRALMGDAPVAAVLFDLDAFKAVNDTFGHRVGDHVLQRFAAAAVAGLRPNDIIGRIGGEEFLAVIPSASLETAVAIAERVRRNFLEAAVEVDASPFAPRSAPALPSRGRVPPTHRSRRCSTAPTGPSTPPRRLAATASGPRTRWSLPTPISSGWRKRRSRPGPLFRRERVD